MLPDGFCRILRGKAVMLRNHGMLVHTGKKLLVQYPG